MKRLPHPWRFHGWALPMGSRNIADVNLGFLAFIDQNGRVRRSTIAEAAPAESSKRHTRETAVGGAAISFRIWLGHPPALLRARLRPSANQLQLALVKPKI